MPKPWLKFWTSILDKEKIQLLSGDQFKAWANLLLIALRHDHDGELPDLPSVAFQARMTVETTAKMLDDFVSMGLFEKRRNRYAAHDWKHWQGDGMSDAQRKAKQRAKSRDMSRDMNGDSHVTNSEYVCDMSRARGRAETKTKTKTKTKKSTSPQAAVDVPDWVPLEPWNEFLAMRLGKRVKNTPYALGLVIKELDKLRASGCEPGAVLNQSIVAGWTDVYPLRGKTNGKASPTLAPSDELPDPRSPEQIKADDDNYERIIAARKAKQNGSA